MLLYIFYKHLSFISIIVIKIYIKGLVQNYYNSLCKIRQLQYFCTKPSICSLTGKWAQTLRQRHMFQYKIMTDRHFKGQSPQWLMNKQVISRSIIAIVQYKIMTDTSIQALQRLLYKECDVRAVVARDTEAPTSIVDEAPAH